MSDEIDDLQDQLSRLPDEDLMRIVTVDAADYRSEAVEFARLELDRRGVREVAPPPEAPRRTSVPAPGDASDRCSFCGRDRAAVRKLFTGPNASICGECVESCHETLGAPGAAEDHPASSPGAQEEPDEEAQTLHVPCAMCHEEVAGEDCLQVPERGPLCGRCVSLIQSAMNEDTGRP